jgi:hypothetical protein
MCSRVTFSRLLPISALLLLSLSISPARAQSKPSAETVLDRFVEVTGGAAAHKGINNMVRHGSDTISIRFPKRSFTFVFTEYYNFAEPKLSVKESEPALEGKGSKSLSGRYGNVSWKYDPNKGPSVEPYTGGDGLPGFGFTQRGGDWRRSGINVTNKGSRKVEGEDCWLIEVTDEDGKVTSCFSKNTGLLLSDEVGFGPIKITYTYSDYRRVNNGLVIPFRTTMNAFGTKVVFSYTDVKINTDIPVSVFEPPVEVRALMNKS